jgi:hypothetical protein
MPSRPQGSRLNSQGLSEKLATFSDSDLSLPSALKISLKQTLRLG